MEGLTYKRTEARPDREETDAHADCPRPDLSPLLRAVQEEVIPRLLGRQQGGAAAEVEIDPNAVETLVGFALAADLDGALGHIDRLVRSGVAEDAVLLNLLCPTATAIGEMWESDRLSFVDVSVGLCTLHQILFRVSGTPQGGESGGRALIASTPGDSHVFGTLVVSRIFGLAGWRTWVEIDAGVGNLADLAAGQAFDAVCLAVNVDRHLETAEKTISAIRDAAERNGTYIPYVIVGGHCMTRDPGIAQRIGADVGASDAVTAARLASARLDRGIGDG